MKRIGLLAVAAGCWIAANPAHGWWISTAFDYKAWDRVSDGHELITLQAIRALRAAGVKIPDAEARQIVYGTRDNDQAESQLMPFGGKAARHVEDIAQRTHSMLPGTFEYIGKEGRNQAARDAAGYVLRQALLGLEAYENLPETTRQCLAKCAPKTGDALDKCEKECRDAQSPLGPGGAGGNTRLGVFQECKRTKCGQKHSGRKSQAYEACMGMLPTSTRTNLERIHRTCKGKGQKCLYEKCKEDFGVGAWLPKFKENSTEWKYCVKALWLPPVAAPEIVRECEEKASGWADQGLGRKTCRTDEDKLSDHPGDDTCYNGLQQLGKGLHALQDSYSPAHVIRQGAGGPIREILAYQSVCTPGGSKLHVTIDGGDSTAKNQSAGGHASNATQRVMKIFLKARDAIRSGQGGASQFRAELEKAIALSYVTDPSYSPRPAVATWTEFYRSKGKNQEVLDDDGKTPLKILTWESIGALKKKLGDSTAFRDRLRKDRDLICGVEAGSDRLGQFLDLQWERIGKRCHEFPEIWLGKEGEFGKVGEYFAENWTCSDDALLAGWASALDEYTSEKARAEGKEVNNTIKAKLKSFWEQKVCKNWDSFGKKLRKLQEAWAAAEGKIQAIKNEVSAILLCTGVGPAVDFIQGRVEDLQEQWKKFKDAFKKWKIGLRMKMKKAASKAFEFVVGQERTEKLKTIYQNLKDWWQNTCLLEADGVVPRYVLPLLTKPFKLLSEVMSLDTNPTYQRMKAATSWLAEKAKSVGAALWDKGSEFIEKWGAKLYGALATAAGKGADVATAGLKGTRTVICDLPGTVKQKVQEALSWAKQKLQKVAQVVSDKADKARQWMEYVTKRWGQAGWDFIQKHGKKALDLLNKYGAPVAQAFKQFGNEVLTRTQELVDKVKGVVSTVKEKVADVVATVKEKVEEKIEQVKETAKKVFNAVGYGGCLVKACISSPVQCAKRSGSDLNRDIATCDQSYGYDSSATFNKIKFLGCAALCCAQSPLQCRRGQGDDFTPCVADCRQ
jgi:gas vesicle protein